MKNFLLKTVSKFKTLITILVILLLSVTVVHFNFFELTSKYEIPREFPDISYKKSGNSRDISKKKSRDFPSTKGHNPNH